VRGGGGGQKGSSARKQRTSDGENRKRKERGATQEGELYDMEGSGSWTRTGGGGFFWGGVTNSKKKWELSMVCENPPQDHTLLRKEIQRRTGSLHLLKKSVQQSERRWGATLRGWTRFAKTRARGSGEEVGKCGNSSVQKVRMAGGGGLDGLLRKGAATRPGGLVFLGGKTKKATKLRETLRFFKGTGRCKGISAAKQTHKNNAGEVDSLTKRGAKKGGMKADQFD